MLKNLNYNHANSQTFGENVKDSQNVSVDWLLASGNFTHNPIDAITPKAYSYRENSPSNDYLNNNFHQNSNITKIKDPLWRRICENILKVLGADAFGDLWKTKLVRISSEGKIAYFVCPAQSIAETIEKYHFVVIGALKEFYPFLSSIETEIKVD